MGPGALSSILDQLPKFQDPNLIVGFDVSDDACVYQISEDLAIVETADFFPPIVDDPYAYGQIAAANSLSDIYAMGGVPRLALNLLCVPNCLSTDVLLQILKGGSDKVIEANCVLAGGHTIEDNEPKYGLCVTGMVHPKKVLKNVGAKPGDLLVLTKPIGSGVLTTAMKADLLEKSSYDILVEQMATLNAKGGAAVTATGGANACTDVTGFGLLGHSYEMTGAGDITIQLSAGAIPFMPQAWDMASMGIIPAGAYRNFDYVKPYVSVADGVPQAAVDLLADPQTSGGLLVALPEEQAKELLSRCQDFTQYARIVGQVLPRREKAVEIVP